ncbi:MAG TPA: aminoglycoside phosphotransferase family protein [bacterium]|nr:aminoglycoside phosphotransferase family protein [bacterium]
MADQALTDKIKKSFPNFKYTSAKILKSGFDHDILLIDKKLIFRFPKSKEYTKLLADEISLLKYLNKKISVNIPQYEIIDKKYQFAAYPIISGKPLNPAYLKQLSSKEKSLLLKQISEFLSDLHKIPIKSLKKYHLAAKTDKTQMFFRQLKQQIFPKLTEKEQVLLEKFKADWQKYVEPVTTVTLTHNDLSPDNIFWDSPQQKLGIIDFSDRKITDPAHDFAPFLEFGENFVKTIYKNYQGKKDATMLKRAFIYYQKIALDLLLLYHSKNDKNWKSAYRLFKKRFPSIEKPS